jgi:hypothetical protein
VNRQDTFVSHSYGMFQYHVETYGIGTFFLEQLLFFISGSDGIQSPCEIPDLTYHIGLKTDFHWPMGIV